MVDVRSTILPGVTTMLKSTITKLAATLAAAALAVTAAPFAQPAEAATSTKVRAQITTVTGDTRFDTAAAVSKATTPKTGGTVFIANGYSYADALAAGPAAAKEDAPILLSTPVGGMFYSALDEMERINPSRIILIGSEAATPWALEQRFMFQFPKATIERVGGKNRMETAQMIADRWFPNSKRVFIANGWKFPDAISASAAGAKAGIPVLLSAQSALSKESAGVISRNQPTDIKVVGSGAALGGMIPAGAQYMAPGATIERLGGVDRYETNAILNNRYFPKNTAPGAVVTTGENYPDALVASAYADEGYPVLLATTNCMTEPVREELVGFAAAATRKLIRVGSSTYMKSWMIRCGDRANYEYQAPAPTQTPKPSPTTTTQPKPTTTTAPKPTPAKTYPATPTDVTATEIRAFIEQYNLMRVGQGKKAIPASNFIIDKGCGSAKVVSQLKTVEATGGFPSDVHAGKCGWSEVWWGNTGNAKYGYDIDGDLPAADWFISDDHKAILYPESDTNLAIVVNIAASNAGSIAIAEPLSVSESDAMVSAGKAIRATTADTTLGSYVAPTGTGKPMPLSEENGYSTSMWPNTPMIVPSTITNTGSARING